jgi:hypothetical protein
VVMMMAITGEGKLRRLTRPSKPLL